MKQTHDIKLAGSLSPITQKVEEVHESTKKLGDVLKDSISENEKNQEIFPVENDSEDDNSQSNIRILPNSNEFSSDMMETLGCLTNSKSCLKLIQVYSSRASILGTPINTLDEDTIQINDIIYITPEIYEALSSTDNKCKTMKIERDILLMNNINNGIRYTSVGDISWKRKTILTQTPPILVYDIQNKTLEGIIDDSDNDLQGQGVKIIIPSNIIDF